MLQSNFTQVATSFNMDTLKLSQFLQNKPPNIDAYAALLRCSLVVTDVA